MSTENEKLSRVKTSCKAASIVSKILFMICIVGTTVTLVTSIVMFFNREKFDNEFETANEENFLGSMGNVAVGNIQSDVPALEKFLEENSDSPSLAIAIYLLPMSLGCAMLSVAMYFFSSIFNIILKEGNPFDDKVIKRVLISMILLTAVLAFSAGGGFAVLGGLVTWVIYTILDYGRVLKIQSDETL